MDTARIRGQGEQNRRLTANCTRDTVIFFWVGVEAGDQPAGRSGRTSRCRRSETKLAVHITVKQDAETVPIGGGPVEPRRWSARAQKESPGAGSERHQKANVINRGTLLSHISQIDDGRTRQSARTKRNSHLPDGARRVGGNGGITRLASAENVLKLPVETIGVLTTASNVLLGVAWWLSSVFGCNLFLFRKGSEQPSPTVVSMRQRGTSQTVARAKGPVGVLLGDFDVERHVAAEADLVDDANELPEMLTSTSQRSRGG